MAWFRKEAYGWMCRTFILWVVAAIYGKIEGPFEVIVVSLGILLYLRIDSVWDALREHAGGELSRFHLLRLEILGDNATDGDRAWCKEIVLGSGTEKKAMAKENWHTAVIFCIVCWNLLKAL